VLVLLLAAEGRGAQIAAAALFVAGAATDGLDGYLARRWETKTRTGAWLDPLADKIFVLATVVTLSALGRFPWWATAIVFVREAAISVLRVILGLRGKSLPASRGAKAKTLTQVLAITLYILPLGSWADELRLAVLVIALILTVVTGVHYVADAAGWLRAHPHAERPAVGRPEP
jgi:CDP-diacylglycerol--glycerol-3-phosphate 3-phosphatidyltransferase